MTDVTRFQPLLDRLQQDSAQYFRSPQVSFEPIWTQERRGSYLLHMRVATAAETFGAFLKIYRSNKQTPEALARMRARIERDYRATLAVHMATASESTLSAVYPIASFPEQFAIITRQADGLTIGRAIEQAARWESGSQALGQLLDTMRSVGRWLTKFQRLDLYPAAAPLQLGDTLEYIDVRLRKLVGASAINADERGAALGMVEEIWQEIPEHHLVQVPIHADYCLGNVLVDRERIVVLDFAMTRQGALYHDLAHMYLQVQMMQAKPWYRPQVMNDLCAALIEGYAPGVRVDEPLFRLLMLHHVLNHLTKVTLRPPRRKLSRPLNWLLRRRHLAWLRENGCFDVRRTA